MNAKYCRNPTPHKPHDFLDGPAASETWQCPGVSDQIIRVIYSDRDVIGIAHELDIPEEIALERAHSWAKHIEETASTLCGEQLASVIEHNQP